MECADYYPLLTRLLPPAFSFVLSVVLESYVSRFFYHTPPPPLPRQDFKYGVTPNHRSSSMSDLRPFAASGAQFENLESPDAAPVLGTKSFNEADF